MTVQELIDMLMKIRNKNRLVILQKDPEGHGFSPAYDGVDANVVWQQNVQGIKMQKLTEASKKMGCTKADVGTGVPAVILWPTS